jgi:site-specific DNA recombinase
MDRSSNSTETLKRLLGVPIVKVIKYTRVSTTEQSDHGVSLAAQDAKLDAYASLYDLKIVGSFQDAESAKSLRRPGLQAALEMLRNREADGILIGKLDRLTRSISDWQVLIDEFFNERAGKQLFSVNDSIDTRSASGRMVLNILLSVAQWEREAIAERTRDALQHKRRNGQRYNHCVYGYDIDGKLLIANQQEQGVIGLMRELRASGLTFRQIAAELNLRRIPTKRSNKPWSYATIHRIINNAHQEIQAN